MRAAVLGDESPNARLSDPTESHEAAGSISVGHKAASQAIILHILRDAGCPLTDEEIGEEAVWFGTWSPSRLRTARAELVEQGLVRKVGTTLPEGHRTHCALWDVTA